MELRSVTFNASERKWVLKERERDPYGKIGDVEGLDAITHGQIRIHNGSERRRDLQMYRSWNKSQEHPAHTEAIEQQAYDTWQKPQTICKWSFMTVGIFVLGVHSFKVMLRTRRGFPVKLCSSGEISLSPSCAKKL